MAIEKMLVKKFDYEFALWPKWARVVVCLRQYFRVGLGKTHFHLYTPLFAIWISFGFHAFRNCLPIHGHESGVRLMFIPYRFDFDVKEGDKLYRFECERMRYTYAA